MDDQFAITCKHISVEECQNYYSVITSTLTMPNGTTIEYIYYYNKTTWVVHVLCGNITDFGVATKDESKGAS